MAPSGAACSSLCAYRPGAPCTLARPARGTDNAEPLLRSIQSALISRSISPDAPRVNRNLARIPLIFAQNTPHRRKLVNPVFGDFISGVGFFKQKTAYEMIMSIVPTGAEPGAGMKRP